MVLVGSTNAVWFDPALTIFAMAAFSVILLALSGQSLVYNSPASAVW